MGPMVRCRLSGRFPRWNLPLWELQRGKDFMDCFLIPQDTGKMPTDNLFVGQDSDMIPVPGGAWRQIVLVVSLRHLVPPDHHRVKALQESFLAQCPAVSIYFRPSFLDPPSNMGELCPTWLTRQATRSEEDKGPLGQPTRPGVVSSGPRSRRCLRCVAQAERLHPG